MTVSDKKAPPVRGVQQEALTVFLGEWRAEGKSYGGGQQAESDPKGAPEPWTSTHESRWHTGQFFLIQDERALTGNHPFDTISVMGVDASTGQYFARTFENHGFYRHYAVTVEGSVWLFAGETERARIEFSPDGRRQTITWEWRPKDRWLPLCDRVAIRQH